MKRVFADTAYWIAMTRPRDQWTAVAVQARAEVGAARIVTTDEVLVEFLNALSEYGPRVRALAIGVVRAILRDPAIEVRSQSRATFAAGLALYEARADKGYSLTDCISMNAMRALAIRAALTNDRHFAQEGFAALMRRAGA